MLIGEAVLKSPAFSSRLVALVQDLRTAGCTVWLEGLRLRFDCSAPGAEPAELGALMKRYGDLVEWSPEPHTEVAEPLNPKTPGRARPFFAVKDKNIYSKRP